MAYTYLYRVMHIILYLGGLRVVVNFMEAF